MGVRKVQLGSIPELAEPAKDVAQPIKTAAPSASVDPSVPVSSAAKPETQAVPTGKSEDRPANAPKSPPKVENPIPEHIPVRLKLELDEQISKEHDSENTSPVAKTPPLTPPIPPKDPEFGFKYVPGEIDKKTASPKEAAPLDFPDIHRKSELPDDPDIE
jgi:hypothetical protein